MYLKYNQANEELDAIKQLETIKQISYNHNQDMYRPKEILLSLKNLLNYQQHDMTNVDEYKELSNRKAVLVLMSQ